MVIKLGITYNPCSDLFLSGSNQTAILLTELFLSRGYEVCLVSTKVHDTLWWNTYPKFQSVDLVYIGDISGLDYLIDIDGLVHSDLRKNVASSSVVFLRSFLQFAELDASVYPELPYQPRSFDGVAEIWCWDILNPPETLDSIQTIFPCPIRRVPFIWSPSVCEHYSGGYNTYNKHLETWTVHIAEKLTNYSSPVMPLVAVREFVLGQHFKTKVICHNVDKIKENKFFVENILNNIEVEKLAVEFAPKVPFYKWLENDILFSHSRFIPLRVGLLNAIWLGIPLVHNSPVVRDIHPELEHLFYFGNEVKPMITAFKQFMNDPDRFYKALPKIRASILDKFSVAKNINGWRKICETVFIQTDGLPIIEKKLEKIVVAFCDMWPGFNCNRNFIMNALREEAKSTEFEGIEYSKAVEPNIVIFGPYSKNWTEIPDRIPKVYFSAENWPEPNDPRINLYLTSSRIENDIRMRIPTWMTFIDWFSGATVLPERCEDNPILLPVHFAMTPHPIRFKDRKEFCGFVVSNPICQMRNETFQIVDTYKRVNSGGALYNNIGGQLSLKYAGGGCGDISKHHFFTDHKITISFENSQASGYITEKVLHAKMAGCLPIYWGDLDTDTDFVPNSFINVSNIQSPDKVLEVIKMIETNEEFCSAVASTPILNEEKRQRALNIMSKMSQKLIALCNYNRINDTKFQAFQKIVVVNLDSRKDRWQSFLNSDKWLSKNATRVSAVDGRNLKMTSYIYNIFKHNDHNWKKSVMGCALSHIEIWKMLVNDSEAQAYLILEDDVRFEKNWTDTWQKMEQEIPPDADIFYLGGVLPPNKSALPICLDSINQYWAKVKPNSFFCRDGVELPIFHFCTYSYILTKKGAKKLLDFLDYSDKKCFTSIDHFLQNPVIPLQRYVAYPLLTHCFQEEDEKYCSADFNNFNRIDTFDSDIWNNTECFSKDEITTYASENITIKSESELVLHYVNRIDLIEKEWLEELFTCKFNLKEIKPFEPVPPHNSWFIVQRPHVNFFKEYFTQLDRDCVPFKVIHLSDEFGADDISFYNLGMCKAVMRNYLRPDIPNRKNILTIPLGYHYKSIVEKSFTDRKLVWSFHGTNWFNRDEQLKHLEGLIPHNCHLIPDWKHSTMSKEEHYLTMLSNSKFCPILRGNNVETFRLYEALECGVIPLYVRQTGDDLYWKWIQENLGLFEVDNWNKAVAFINIYIQNGEAAEKNRRTILEKWCLWKNRISEVIKHIL